MGGPGGWDIQNKTSISNKYKEHALASTQGRRHHGHGGPGVAWAPQNIGRPKNILDFKFPHREYDADKGWLKSKFNLRIPSGQSYSVLDVTDVSKPFSMRSYKNASHYS